MTVSGYKTYLVSVALILFGVALLFLPDTASWDTPGAVDRAALGELLGWFCIISGLRDLSMRHSIAKLERSLKEIL